MAPLSSVKFACGAAALRSVFFLPITWDKSFIQPLIYSTLDDDTKQELDEMDMLTRTKLESNLITKANGFITDMYNRGMQDAIRAYLETHQGHRYWRSVQRWKYDADGDTEYPPLANLTPETAFGAQIRTAVFVKAHLLNWLGVGIDERLVINEQDGFATGGWGSVVQCMFCVHVQVATLRMALRLEYDGEGVATYMSNISKWKQSIEAVKLSLCTQFMKKLWAKAGPGELEFPSVVKVRDVAVVKESRDEDGKIERERIVLDMLLPAVPGSVTGGRFRSKARAARDATMLPARNAPVLMEN